MTKLLVSATLVALSSGCASYLAGNCVSRASGACQGGDAVLAASLLVVEKAVWDAEPLPPLRQDPPDAPGPRPSKKILAGLSETK